ncbi:MAG TPA: hypothetical protein VLT81_12965, partial [Chondromyces sp.]|nr:hypothetical protein [Chondromyces sp.]
DDDSHLQVTTIQGRTLFVAVALTAGAASATPNQFKVVHRAEASAAEDRDHDLELVVESAEDVTSTAVTAEAPPSGIFADDFESGGTSEWSSTVGG